MIPVSTLCCTTAFLAPFAFRPFAAASTSTQTINASTMPESLSRGLYAVGNCSGGFYGGVDYPLTVGGLSIGRCYTEGYVTGKLVASL